MMFAFVAFFIGIVSADSGLYLSLVDGTNESYKAQVYEHLQRETSIFKKREILKAIALQREQLYNLKEFEGKVVPFNSGCLKAKDKPNLCSSFDDFHFFLIQEKNMQTLDVQFRNTSVLKYTTHSRTLLDSSVLFFGKALHLIINTKIPGTFFLLIREIETPKEKTQPVRETVDVFRVNKDETCRIAEVDTTIADGGYEYLVEYIRVFGTRPACNQSPFIF